MVGVVGATVDIGLLNLLHLALGIDIYIAIFWAFIAGTTTAYVLNNNWTFQRLNNPIGWEKSLKYLSIGAVGLGLTELIMHILVGQNEFNFNIAKLVAIGIVFFWNFTANRYWTFHV